MFIVYYYCYYKTILEIITKSYWILKAVNLDEYFSLSPKIPQLAQLDELISKVYPKITYYIINMLYCSP